MKKGLTEKQRRSHEMRVAGRSWVEIGAAMGITPYAAQKLGEKAQGNGLEPLLKKFEEGDGLFTPPVRADGQGASGEPQFDGVVFSQMARAAGVPLKVAQALARRIEAQFGVVKEELKEMSLAERVRATTLKAQMLLDHIDEVSMAGTGVKDLAIAYGVLTDKALLLGGKPTQIVDFNVRASLQVLMPQMMAEAKRRGITIEGEVRRLPEPVVITG